MRMIRDVKLLLSRVMSEYSAKYQVGKKISATRLPFWWCADGVQMMIFNERYLGIYAGKKGSIQ